jgi:hypothetical protein
MEKEIRIFDTSNNVLNVSGIGFELFDVGTGTRITSAASTDLNPPHIKLVFSTSYPGPFEVYTNDPTYKYPGNVIESLEGANTNRIDIDLQAVPAHASGQGSPSTAPTVMEVLNWIQAAPKWTEFEKRAVRNLFLNYIKLVAGANGPPEKTQFADVVHNWQKAMSQLGIPFGNFR